VLTTAHEKNIVFIKPKSKDFCRAFCKKLAAGGIRVPDKSKFDVIHSKILFVKLEKIYLVKKVRV